MWWVTSGVGSTTAGAQHREHAVEVADDVRVAGAQRQRLDPDDAHVDLGALGVDAGHRDAARLARQAAGEVERVRMADRVHREVDPAALGRRLTSPRGSASVRWTGTAPNDSRHRAAGPRPCRPRRRPTRPRRAPPGPRTARPGRARAPRRGRAGLEARPVDRVVAGAHHVAGEQRHLVGEPVGHPPQRQVGGRDEQQLGLGALQRAERLAVPEDPSVVALVVLSRAGRRSSPRRRCGSSRAPGRPRRPVTASPAASTVPTYSWPIVKPGSIWTRPW